MSFILQPWQLFFMILAAWINHHQQQVNDFQRAQIKVLLEAQGKKRVLLNDDQRRLLAIKGCEPIGSASRHAAKSFARLNRALVSCPCEYLRLAGRFGVFIPASKPVMICEVH